MPRRSGPHGLDYDMSRRSFFRALLLEARHTAASLRGQPTYALSALKDLPDEELAGLIPEIQPAYALHVEGERLVARHRETGAALDLGPASAERVVALNLFDGRRTLDAAGRRLAREMEWPPEEGQRTVRELFLALAALLVCLPRNSPGLE